MAEILLCVSDTSDRDENMPVGQTPGFLPAPLTATLVPVPARAGVSHRASTVCRALLLMLALNGCGQDTPVAEVSGGKPERGKELIASYGCASCHTIPGIPGHGSNVGPPLAKLGKRAYIGGVIPNTPEDLMRWLRDPPAVDPRTAMPNLGISESEARDIAAYLYTLR